MGEVRFYVLGLGYLELDLAWLVNNPGPYATVKHPDRSKVWYRGPILAYLLVHPEAVVLYDTGCSPEAMSQRPPSLQNVLPFYCTEAELLENRLSEVGLRCKDVDIVVASHMHFDHVGNLPLFKDSKLLVPKADFAHALVVTHSDLGYIGPYFKSTFAVEGLHYELVEEDMEILPGVEVVTLEGHVPGILGLVVHLKNSGTIICPSDGIPTRMNYGPPPRMPGEIYDSLGFERTIKKVRNLQRMYNAQIFYSHDNEQYEKELLKSPDFYS